MLRDVCDAFGDDDRMHSAELIAALVRDPESEWLDLWGKPLDQRRLAKELKRYGVESENIRIRDVIRKGYVVDGERGLGRRGSGIRLPVVSATSATWVTVLVSA